MIVDDHSMVRQGLKQLLELDGDMKVIAEAGNGKQCLQMLSNINPDVILLDINMPEVNGLEVLEKLHSNGTKYKVIVLTVHSEVEYLLKAIDIGINGYMLKDSNLDELKKAITAVFNGETYIEPNMIPLMNNQQQRRESEIDVINSMTKRELDVLKLLARGMLNRDIADHLEISERTVKNHIFSIFKKLNVTDRTQAAVFAIRNKIVDIYSEE